MTSQQIAYMSRLLNERYLLLQGVLTHARLKKKAKEETVIEMRLIETIQRELVPE